MIDKARIEQHMAWVERQISNDYVKVSVFAEDYRKLLTDYLALRGIVEALAAEDAVQEGWTLDNTKAWECERCGAWSHEGPQWIKHSERCLFARAVALVGPAGERAEEANG